METIIITTSQVKGTNTSLSVLISLFPGYPDYEELKRDAPGSPIRIFVLIVYMLVNVIVAAALILLVVMAPTRS